MRRLSHVMLGLMLGSIAFFPALAAADDGLTVLVFVTPEGRDVGQTVDVHVEAYAWGAPVDLETLDVMIGFFGGTPLTLMNMSTGKWHAIYTIESTYGSAGYFIVSADAVMGVLSDTAFQSYDLPNAGAVSSEWEVTVRVANLEQVGYSVGPGATVILEGRSYFNGTLSEGGPLNASVAFVDGSLFSLSSGTPTYDNMTGTKQSDGVYRFNIVVPSTLLVTRAYVTTVMLGTGFDAADDSAAFFAHPFPVVGYVSASTTTSATVKVWAGLSSAISGAEVKLYGQVLSFSTFQVTNITPATGTTDARGSANVTVSWSATGIVTLFANVTAGGKTTILALYVFGGTETSGWVPTPNIPYGCSASLQTDPSNLKGGQTATLKFRVTEDGTLLASRPLTRFVWREGGPGTVQAGNVTMDAQGNFTLTYAIPSDWTSADTLVVRVVCPSGISDFEYVSFGGAGMPDFSSSKVSVAVTNAKLGAKMHVTATYSGTNPLEGAVALAFLIPGNSTGVAVYGLGGLGPQGVLARSGTTFAGDIDVPSFYPDGNYVLLVVISNEGATNARSSQTTEGNVSLITMGAASGPGGAGGGLFGMPGFDAAAALGAAGVAALAAAEVRRRRLE